jgi:hypothetical protein
LRYNPFARGAHPVGVRTIQLADTAGGNRPVTVEIWYPAAARCRGQDLDPATRDRFTFAPELPEASQDAVRDADPAGGRFPLVMHNHGFFGHRRVNTTLCTHLASHGYIVASNDVPWNTTGDLLNDVIAHRRGGRPTAPPPREINRTRVAIASFVIESVWLSCPLPPAPLPVRFRASPSVSRSPGWPIRDSSSPSDCMARRL